MSKQIALITKEVTSLAIEDQPSLEKATLLLSRVNKTIDKLEEERVKVTGPLNAALKAENARFQPYIKQGKDIVKLIKDKMTDYRQVELEKQAKIAARVEKGTMKVDTAANKLAEMNESKAANTSEGAIKFRKKETLHIIDSKDIPLEYFDLNQTRLLKALKEGAVMKGAELITVEIPVNSR